MKLTSTAKNVIVSLSTSEERQLLPDNLSYDIDRNWFL